MNRRDALLRLAGLAAAPPLLRDLPGIPSRFALPVSRASLPAVQQNIGLAVYTVRGLAASDPMGTMHAIADIGYRDLDMYPDVFGLSPRDTREGLARFGLACRSSRFTTAALYGAFDQVLDVAKYLGARWVTLANVPAEERRTWGDWNNLIAAIVRGAEAARKAGLTFCYHHHDFELQSLEGRVPLDVLLASTDPELVRLQMDVYWMTKGGRNPVSEIRRLGGRVASLHLKDMNATPDRGIITPGRGTIDFAAVLRAASAATVMDVFVEEDNPGAPMEAARFAFQHLSRI